MDKDKVKQRVEFYEKGNIPIHLTTEYEEWINGYITKIDKDYFMILDRYDGEKQIFFTDVRRLSYFTGDLETLKKPEKGGNR